MPGKPQKGQARPALLLEACNLASFSQSSAQYCVSESVFLTEFSP